MKVDSAKVDTQWTSSKEFVLLKKGDTIDIYRKARFNKTFKDFPAKIYTAPKAPLNYNSHPAAQKYETMIAKGYESGEVNFAGHYLLAGWRSGTQCFDHAIVDVKNGTVFYPEMMVCLGMMQPEHLLACVPDSRLLIKNPPDSMGWFPVLSSYGEFPKYYLWEKNQLRLLYSEK